MRLRMSWGELMLALIFMGLGAFWCVMSLRMPMWNGGVPDSGFLPLVYGGLVIVLSAGVILSSLGSGEERVAGEPIAQGLMVLAVLAAGVGGIEPIGFFASMFAMQLFLYAVIERKPVVLSIAVAFGSALFLKLVFQTWLSVPLPKGPWGF